MMYLFLLGIGACVGSFLTVIVDRLPRRETIIKGRSHCEHCQHTLSWNDMIPVLSFFFLRGKCRYCHFPIGWQYPVIESLTAIIFLLTVIFISVKQSVFNSSAIAELFYLIVIVSSLIVIFFIDLKYGIIPDTIVYPITSISFLYQLFYGKEMIFNHMLSGLIAFSFFFFLFFITKGKGMGFGDVKLSFFLGLFLGFPKIVVGIYIAFLTGAIVAIILILARKKKFSGGTIPFGPFLVLGTLTSLYYGEFFLEQTKLFLLR